MGDAPMRNEDFLALASEFRARAGEMFARAETVNDAGATQTMREIAAGYEELAQRIEQTVTPQPQRAHRRSSPGQQGPRSRFY